MVRYVRFPRMKKDFCDHQKTSIENDTYIKKAHIQQHHNQTKSEMCEEGMREIERETETKRTFAASTLAIMCSLVHIARPIR